MSHKDEKRAARQQRLASENDRVELSHGGKGISQGKDTGGPPSVEARRAHAIEIMLSRFGKRDAWSLETIAEAVKALDYDKLSLDDVCALHRYQLTSDEQTRFLPYLGTSDNKESRGLPQNPVMCDAKAESKSNAAEISHLGKAERYLVLMGRVPQVNGTVPQPHSNPIPGRRP